MFCKNAITEIKCVIGEETPAAQALAEMKAANVSLAPVLDGKAKILGLFTLRRFLADLMPVSVSIGQEAGKVRIPTAPGMARRLEKNGALPVSAFMDRQFQALGPDSPLEAAIRHIQERGEAVPIIDEKTGRFLGLVSAESVLEALGKKAAAS